jgi:hypothetical protein
MGSDPPDYNPIVCEASRKMYTSVCGNAVVHTLPCHVHAIRHAGAGRCPCCGYSLARGNRNHHFAIHSPPCALLARSRDECGPPRQLGPAKGGIERGWDRKRLAVTRGFFGITRRPTSPIELGKKDVRLGLRGRCARVAASAGPPTRSSGCTWASYHCKCRQRRGHFLAGPFDPESG